MKSLSLGSPYFFIRIAAFLLLVSLAQQVPAISLDQTFGSNGKLTVDFSNSVPRSSQAFWIFHQPSGRIVLTGYHDGTGPLDLNSAVATCGLTQSGATDDSFGTSGKILEWNNFLNVIDMKAQSDGKMLRLSSLQGNFPLMSSAVLTRLNPNGHLDNTFSADLNIGIDDTRPYKIAIRHDGKIYVLLGPYSGTSHSLVRLNSDGARDVTFGPNGVRLFNLIRLGTFAIEGLNILDDGRLLMGGVLQTTPAPLGARVVWMARFDEYGNLDRSFGNHGIVRREFSRSVSISRTIVQPDGKYLAVGTSRSGSVDSKLFMVRFTSRGRPDPGFGSNGVALANVSTNPASLDSAIAGTLISGDRIILVGTTKLSGATETSFLAARFSGSGELENTMYFQFTPGLAAGAYDATVQSDGKLLVTGFTRNPDAVANGNLFAVARFNPGV